MAFFSYVKTYHNGLGRPPRHGFIKATFSIAENRVFDCHNDSIVERNYSVIDRQYETVWFCLAFNQQLSNNGHGKTGEAKNQTNNPWFITEWFIHYERKISWNVPFPPFLRFWKWFNIYSLNLIQLHTKCMHAFKGPRTVLMKDCP